MQLSGYKESEPIRNFNGRLNIFYAYRCGGVRGLRLH